MGFLHIQFLFTFKSKDEVFKKLTWKEENSPANNTQTLVPE